MKKTGFLFIAFILFAASVAFAAVPSINVRAGIHARYNRLVFDWTENVRYTMKQQGGMVIIQFDKPATANLKDVEYTNPPFIHSIKQENTAEGLRVTFEIPDKSRVQAFWSGKSVAFDVLRLDTKAPEFKSEPAKKEVVAATATPPPAAPATPPVQITTATPPKLTETNGPQKAQKIETNVETAVKTPELAEAKPAQNKSLQTLADILTNKPNQAPIQNRPSAILPPPPSGDTTIVLKPTKLTRLAVFERVGRLWVVVDSDEKDFLPIVEGEWAEAMKKVTRIIVGKATAFVFELPGDISTTPMAIRRNGPEWSILLNPTQAMKLPAEMPIRVVDGAKGEQPTVTLYAGEQPTVLTFKDSKMGDRLWVVPVRSPEGRIIQPRKTAAYYLLPSYMGGVIAPRDDNLRISTLNDLVVMSPASGHTMLLSDGDDRKKGIIKGAATPAFRLDVPLAESKNKDFVDQRQELEAKLVDQNSPDAKALSFMNMARLYLQQGFAAEASGLLRIALRYNDKLVQKQDYRALRGMAAAMGGDFETAENDLKSDDLHSQPLAQLWLGYAYARDNQFGLAREAFAESGSSDESLPEPLQKRIALAKAEAALDGGDMATAEYELKKIMDKGDLSPAEKAAYDYIRATILLVTENKPEGIEMYQALTNGPDQLYRAKSELELVAQQIADKKMEPAKAIEELEGLRFSWRGDRLEVRILRDLGKYYVQNNDYMNGLSIWRQAAGLSKDPDDTDAITQDMQNAFKELYVEGKADKLEPLKALSVFDRFRELTPSGEDGKTARMRLADRLISVDLLDQADALMENQLLKNASGLKAVELGTKLANIRLLNRNPSGAVKVLDESENAEVTPEKLTKRRILLKARALADLGQVDEALALLQDDLFPEGLSLKADINWRQARWSQAVLTLQKLVMQYRDQGKGAVDGPMPPLILKMAIALSLDDNRKGLDLLIAEYGPFMSKTTSGASFDLITKPSRGSSLADLDTLKKQVGEVELFETFLKNFNS